MFLGHEATIRKPPNIYHVRVNNSELKRSWKTCDSVLTKDLTQRNKCIVMSVMKMGNIVPKAGFSCIPVQFANYLGSLMSSPYSCPPVFAAPVSEVRADHYTIYQTHTQKFTSE